MDGMSKFNSNDFFIGLGNAIDKLTDVEPSALLDSADGIKYYSDIDTDPVSDDIHERAFTIFRDNVLKNFYQYLQTVVSSAGSVLRKDSPVNIALLHLIGMCDKYIEDVELGALGSDNFLNFTYNIYKMAKDIHNNIRKETLAESVLGLMRPILEKDEDSLHKFYGASRIKGYTAKEFASYLRGIIMRTVLNKDKDNETIGSYERHDSMESVRDALDNRYSELLKWGETEAIEYDADKLAEYIDRGDKLNLMVNAVEKEAEKKFDGPLNDEEKRNLRQDIEWLAQEVVSYPKELVYSYLQKKSKDSAKAHADAARRIGLSKNAGRRAFEPSARAFDNEISPFVHPNAKKESEYFTDDNFSPRSTFKPTGKSLPPEDKGTSLLADEVAKSKETANKSDREIYIEYRDSGAKPYNAATWEFENNVYGLSDKYNNLPKDKQDEVDQLEGYNRNLAILKYSLKEEDVPEVGDKPVDDESIRRLIIDYISRNSYGFGDAYNNLSREDKDTFNSLPAKKAFKFLMDKSPEESTQDKWSVEDAASIWDK